jgi:hypothetical protein
MQLQPASPRAALWWLFGAALFAGVAPALPAGAWSVLHAILSNLALGFLPFLWYCRDSDACQFHRTLWWNMGMVALLFPTLPLYLWRTRARGRRLKAIGKAGACALVLLVAAGLGALLALLAGVML